MLTDYPYLEREDVLAALEYAAAAAQERELAVATPGLDCYSTRTSPPRLRVAFARQVTTPSTSPMSAC